MLENPAVNQIIHLIHKWKTSWIILEHNLRNNTKIYFHGSENPAKNNSLEYQKGWLHLKQKNLPT